MASADLGVRIILDDLAGSGISSLNIGMLGLGGTINYLIGLWSQLTPIQRDAAAVVAGAAIDYKLFSDALSTVTGAAGDLQDSMVQVDIAVQGASARAADMQATLTNLADYSIFSSQQVADGFAMLGERGQTAATIIDDGVGKAMVDLAESIKSETVPAADLLGSALNMFNLKATDAQSVASQLTAAYYNGIPSVTGLQQAFAQGGEAAHAAGMSMGDFLATMDTLVKDGLPASQAASSLRYMLQSLEMPTAKAAKEMANLGVLSINDAAPGLAAVLNATNALNKTPLQLTGTLTDLQTLYTDAQKVGALHTDQSFMQWAVQIGAVKSSLYDANGNFKNMSGLLDILGPKLASLKTPQDFQDAMDTLFNVRSGKGATALLSDLEKTKTQFDGVKRYIDEAANSNLALTDSKKVTQTYSGSVKELGSTVHSVAAQIGSPVINALTPVNQWLNNTLNAIRTQHPDWLNFVGVFLMVGKVVSGLALGGGALVLILTVFDGVLAPIIGIVLAVAAGIAALSAGIAFLITHWKQISDAIQPVIVVIQNLVNGAVKFLGPLFKDTGNELSYFGGVIKSALVPVLQGQLKPAWDNLVNAFKQAQPAFHFIIQVSLMISKILLVTLAPVFIAVFALIIGAIHGFITFFAGIVLIFSGLIGIISGVLQVLLGVFRLIFGVIRDIVTGNFKQIPKDVMGALSTMGTGILDILKGLMSLLLGLFTATFGSLASIVAGAVSGIIGFIQHLGAAFMQPIDDIIGKIGQFLSALQKIPGVGSVVKSMGSIMHIPGLAEGGVVTGPTLAVVGEGREPEVVLPVSKLAAFMGNYKATGQSGGSGTTVVNNIIDSKVVSQAVVNHMTGEVKALGGGRMFR